MTEDVFVVRRLSHALLGRPAIESLGLVSSVIQCNQRVVYYGNFRRYLTDSGNWRATTQSHCEMVPYALTTPRRVAIPLLPKGKSELECMERMGVVSHVQVPTDWCAGRHAGGTKIKRQCAHMCISDLPE